MPDNSLKLGATAESVLRAVGEMSLASTEELANVLGSNVSSVSRRLHTLEEHDLVDGAVLGAAFPPAKRYRLKPAGASNFLEPERYFHLPRQLNTLVAFMPGLEWFYRLAPLLPELAGIGSFRAFEWRFREGVDAMVHSDDGTAALIWSGLWHKESDLMDRLQSLTASASEMGGYPALVCPVACDHWQFHRVRRMFEDFGIHRGFMVICAETGRTWGDPTARDGAVRLSPWPRLGSAEHVVRGQQPRMMSGVRSGKDSHLVHRVLSQVEQFPGATVSRLCRAVGSHYRYVSEKEERLVNTGMIVKVEKNLYLADDMLVMAAHRDRVSTSRPSKRFGIRKNGLPAAARHRRHDAAAFSIVSVFREYGFPVAGGWRGEDFSGGEDAIVPDAMIYVGDGSSGGSGWRYLEYERRANSNSDVAEKLRGYLGRRSQYMSLPLLVVARSESVAREFRDQAAKAGHPLWATPASSIRIGKPGTIQGPTTVWLDGAGEPAVLLPPGDVNLDDPWSEVQKQIRHIRRRREFQSDTHWDAGRGASSVHTRQ